MQTPRGRFRTRIRWRFAWYRNHHYYICRAWTKWFVTISLATKRPLVADGPSSFLHKNKVLGFFAHSVILSLLIVEICGIFSKHSLELWENSLFQATTKRVIIFCDKSLEDRSENIPSTIYQNNCKLNWNWVLIIKKYVIKIFIIIKSHQFLKKTN